MATLFFEGFERGYINTSLDENYWSTEPSQGAAANPLYSFGGYTSYSGVSGEYCWLPAAEAYLTNKPNTGYFDKKIQPAKPPVMWQYAVSKYPTQLMTGITLNYLQAYGNCGPSPGNSYPSLGTTPGFLSLTNIDGRNQFNYAEIDSVNLTGFSPISEDADRVFFTCRWLGIETQHPDFIAQNKNGRYGDRHPLISFCSGEQELLFSIVNVSGTGWFRNKKIDGDRTEATMGLRVEQNGVLKGVFDLNISGVNGIDNFQIQSIADETGVKRMDVETGKILSIQNVDDQTLYWNKNIFSTMSRWAFLNIEIKYSPNPYVSLQIEGVDALAIPLDDPSVDLSNRSDPRIEYVVPIDDAPFDQIKFFNRTYDPEIKNIVETPVDPNNSYNCPPGIPENPYRQYASCYVMEGSVILLDDISLVDNSPSVSPNVRVGPDAHVCRLFPGLVALDESNGNDKFGLGDDYMYPDGKSEWTAVYEAVDEAYAFTGAVFDPYLPSVPVREINEGDMVAPPQKAQKRASVKDADCSRSYIHTFREGATQTFPFLPIDYIKYFGYSPSYGSINVAESHIMYDPSWNQTTGICLPFTDRGFLRRGDHNSDFRYYLSSGIAGIKIQNQYYPRNLNSSFENVFWGPESQDWPDVDLVNMETHLIWYDQIPNTTNVFDTGTRINRTYYPDDRMAQTTGLGFEEKPDISQVREFYDLWDNGGRGLNIVDSHVTPYMANLGPLMHTPSRYSYTFESPNYSVEGTNDWSWRCSGVQSGMPWVISAWVYFKEEDDIIHLHSRYMDDELNENALIDFQRNYKGVITSSMQIWNNSTTRWPQPFIVDCENDPAYTSYCPNPPGVEWSDIYSIKNAFFYKYRYVRSVPSPPSDWPTGLGPWWPFALYTTRSGIRLSTIGAETNPDHHRFAHRPGWNPLTDPVSQESINDYNVPETWQWSGTLQDPLIYRDFFYSGVIPTGQWCHIEISKDEDRNVRVFCSGIPHSGHQVGVKSHPNNHYLGLAEQLLGEKITGPTTDPYKFNASGWQWTYRDDSVYGGGTPSPYNSEYKYAPTDVGPLFNAHVVQGGAFMFDTFVGQAIVVTTPPRVGGPNSMLQDYIYITGEILHTGEFPVPDKWIPTIDDFYNSCEVQMTGKTECNTTDYYLYQDPYTEQMWDSGLFIEQSGFRFGVRKT
jgi:hypothetical protein